MKNEEQEFKEFVINSTIPFSMIFKRIGVSVNYQGNLFCPFHENVRTPSAKLYQNPEGDKIYCFSERRIYRPVDAIKRRLVNFSIGTIFDRIWAQLSEDRKNKLRTDFGKPIQMFPEGWEKIEEKLIQFEKGDISLETMSRVFLKGDHSSEIPSK